MNTNNNRFTIVYITSLISFIFIYPLIMQLLYELFDIFYSHIINYVIGGLLLFGLLIFPFIVSEKPPLHKISWKKLSFWNVLPIFLLIAFLIWAIISTFFAENIDLALKDYSQREEGLIMYFCYAAFMFVCFFIREPKYIKTLLYILTTVSMILSIITFFVFFFPAMKPEKLYSAGFSNTNHLAYYLVICIIASAGLFILDKNYKLKILNIWNFFILNASLVINDTFGSILAVNVGFAILIIFLLIRNKSEWKYILTLIVVCLVSFEFGGVLFQHFWGKDVCFNNYVKLITDIKQIFTHTSTGEEGTNRWALWLEAMQNMVDKPLFGIGINCQIVHNMHITSSRPHNEILQFGSTMGIPSLIFYCSALIILFIIVCIQLKKINPYSLICLICAFTYVASSFFGVSLPYTFIYYVIMLGLGLSGINYYKTEKNTVNN